MPLATRRAGGCEVHSALPGIRHAVVALALAMLGGCAAVLNDVPRPESFALVDPEATTLGKMFAAAADAHPGLSGIHMLDSGADALQARAALADVAERTLDLQYFSVGDDRSTDVLMKHVVRASQRGVRVRILLDDLRPEHRDFARRVLASAPTAELRLFNPFLSAGTSGIERLIEFAIDGTRLNRRMHNKLWVADNAAVIIGGRNLGDEYFDIDAESNFSDLDVLAVGPVVNALSRCFDAYWNSPDAIPLPALDLAADTNESTPADHRLETRLSQAAAEPYRLRDSALPQALTSGAVSMTWAQAQAGCDPPGKPSSATSDELFHVWPDADGKLIPTRSELIVVTPYFISSRHAREHLQQMRERGLRVAVLTNSLASTDSPAAHGGYARYRAELLRRGVEIFELRPEPGDPHPVRHRWHKRTPAALHAKIVIVDRTRAIIGSSNQDPRSRLHNTESWVTIDSPALASRMAALFDESTQDDHAYRVRLRDPLSGDDALIWETVNDGARVRYEAEPGVSAWMRWWMTLLSIMLPEDLL